MSTTTKYDGPTLNQDYNRCLARWQSNNTGVKPECEECGCDLTGRHVIGDGNGWMCEECAEDFGLVERFDDYGYEDDLIDGVGFADPGGVSALRAETLDNPRNLPCPSCGRENMLTPADRARGYQCDICARECEMGF